MIDLDLTVDRKNLQELKEREISLLEEELFNNALTFQIKKYGVPKTDTEKINLIFEVLRKEYLTPVEKLEDIRTIIVQD